MTDHSTRVTARQVFRAAAAARLKPVSVLDVGARPNAALDMSHDQRAVAPHADHLSTRRTVAVVTDSALTLVSAAVRTRMFTRQLTYLAFHARGNIIGSVGDRVTLQLTEMIGTRKSSTTRTTTRL